MGNKAFAVILSILLATFAFNFAIKYYRPTTAQNVDLESFPIKKAEWSGQRDIMPDYVIEMLNPQQIFSATYTNPKGIKIQLLIAYYSGKRKFGGPHSPRNCLPGGGWNIGATEDYYIKTGDRTINAVRFHLKKKEAKQLMDFWYITKYGETGNDYVFKLYSMLSSCMAG